jgi:hypothetical protein
MTGLASSPHGANRNAGTIEQPHCRPRIAFRFMRATLVQIVGWAKARSAVPTRLIAAEFKLCFASDSGDVGTLRFAHPTLAAVMPALVAGIHDLRFGSNQRRGWPEQVRP